MPAVLLGSAVFLGVLLWLPLRFRVKIHKDMEGPVRVLLFVPARRRPFTWVLPAPSWERVLALVGGSRGKPGRPARVQVRRGLRLWRQLNRLAGGLYAAVVVRHWELHLRLGAGDAAATAWLVGGAWAWQARAQSLLARRMPPGVRPRVYIEPSFLGSGWAVDLDCVVGLRVYLLGPPLLGLLAALSEWWRASFRRL